MNQTKHLVTLVETRRGREICETTPRYDIYVNGVNTLGQLCWNMTGYVGVVPLSDGTRFALPESSITAWRKLVRQINRGALA